MDRQQAVGSAAAWQSKVIMYNLSEAARAYSRYMLEEQKLQIPSSVPTSSEVIAEFGEHAEICGDDNLYDNVANREMFMSLADYADSAGNVLAETSCFDGHCMTSSVITMREVIEELSKHPEIRDDFDLFYFGTEFLRDEVMREVFMSIREDMKVRWLTKAHQDSGYEPTRPVGMKE